MIVIVDNKLRWKNLIRGIIGGAKQNPYITEFKGTPTSEEPATPESNYICQNCGMLIKTSHKHTRQECREYQSNPINPDLRALRVILPSRNEPKIRLPYYYDCSAPTTKEEVRK